MDLRGASGQDSAYSTCTRHSSLIDLDLDRDGALLGLKHNQVMVVRDVLNRSLEQASAGDDAQRDKRSHDVDFAIRQAIKKRIS